MHDKVTIELELKTQSVSVICDETWKYQVYLIDDKKQLLMDHENWTNLNMNGRQLALGYRQNIPTAFPGLDVICDTDEEHDFDIQFEAITERLQLNLAEPYSFDPIHKRFIVHREAEYYQYTEVAKEHTIFAI